MEKIIAPDALAITPVHGGTGHAHFVGPFGQRHGAAIVFMVNVAASVCALILWHAPNAVVWAVRAIVVNALNRVSCRRTCTHVLNEIFKGAPALANGNAALAVIVKVLRSWIGAAVDHAGPDSMFARARCAMRAQSFGVAPSKLFTANAAAGQAATVQQVGSRHQLGLSAGALTKPSRFAARCAFTSMQRDKSAKHLARQIVSFNHNQHCITPL